MQIENIRLIEIHPYEKNPRNNKPAIDAVAASIKEFGFKVPIIIDKDNIIVAGHTRYAAAKKLGMDAVPCIRANDLNEEQIKAFRLADNKVSELAEWDFDLLNEELADISLDMTQFGFELLSDQDNKEVIEDEAPEPQPEPKSRPGQIYQLGNHRLMCGDSTSIEDVQKLMDGCTADLVVTDPPYNVAIENSKGMKIQNDDMGKSEFLEFLTQAFYNLNAALKPGGVFYVWFASREHINFETALLKNNLEVRQELIWNKNGLILGRQDYQWKHEPCLYGWKEGAPHYFFDDRTQTTVIEDKKPDIKKMKKEEMAKLLEEIYSDKISTTIINEDKPSVNDLHPTMKPIKLIARQVKNSSKIGERVLDLFGGSGSTLITCEQLDRECYTMEYDPIYVDVIIQRWENFTGKKAVLIND